MHSLEFLGLSDRHSEDDLHGALLQHLHELYARLAPESPQSDLEMDGEGTTR